MPSIRSLVTLILVSLFVSAGCDGGKDNNKGGSNGTETPKHEPTPSEPKGPGGGEMK
jgi:hypothetical protein